MGDSGEMVTELRVRDPPVTDIRELVRGVEREITNESFSKVISDCEMAKITSGVFNSFTSLRAVPSVVVTVMVETAESAIC